jgi:hypothetical protein
MEFNTKLSKLIARRKVIETRKRLNKIVQSPFEINNTLKTVYQNNVVDNNKTETYFIVNSIFYNDCEDKTKVPISSIKSVLYSLKKKGFISNYKDKHNNIIKSCYIIK